MHSTPTRNKLALVHSLQGGWLLLLLALFIHEAGCGRTSQSTLQERLRHIVGTAEIPRFVLRGEAETAPWKQTQVFYRQRDFHPAWIRDRWLGGRTTHSQTGTLLKCLRDASQEGLDPSDIQRMIWNNRFAESSARRHRTSSPGWTQDSPIASLNSLPTCIVDGSMPKGLAPIGRSLRESGSLLRCWKRHWLK